MRLWLRRSVSVLAIYVIALTTILSAFAVPQAANAAVDPFSIICHSGPLGAAQTDTGPATPASLPNHACDHCTLCGAAPTAAPDAIHAGHLAPSLLLQVLTPRSHKARAHLAATQHSARGPPQLA
jgi:hypothetical protein